MKNKKLNKMKLKALQEIGGYKYGLQKETTNRHTLRVANIPFEDHTGYILKVTALLEVCILALDGQGNFHSKMLSNHSLDTSVQMVLEMVIEMMPHDDMFKLEQMMTILEEDLNNNYYPKKLKEGILKNSNHEKEKTTEEAKEL